MTINLQQRINQLANRARARRKAKPISGSLVQFEITRSQSFNLHIPAGESTPEGYRAHKRIKFIPEKQGENFIFLSVLTLWPKLTSVQLPQAGDGSTIMHVNGDGSFGVSHDVSFQIVAIGTTKGSFVEV